MEQDADNPRAARGSRRFISQFAELEFSEKPKHRSFRAVLLVDLRGGTRRLVAVVVSQLNDEQRARPPQPLLAQIAAQLLDHGDVRGVGLDDSPPPLLAQP